MALIFTFLSGAVGAFLAHFAAKYVEREFQIGRDHEAQRDADLELFLDEVDNITALSVDYWTNCPKDLGNREISISADITAGLYHLNLINSMLFKDETTALASIEKCIRELIKSASGGDFKDPDRKISPDNVHSALIAQRKLKHSARMERRKLKRHKFG